MQKCKYQVMFVVFILLIIIAVHSRLYKKKKNGPTLELLNRTFKIQRMLINVLIRKGHEKICN